jgi:DNA-binding Lrp family transcriptional regulator
MNSRAYILVNTRAAETNAVYNALVRAKLVTQVDIITGPYDLIAVLEGTEPDELLRFLMSELRHIDGIHHTVTCFALSSEPEK